MKKTVSHGIFLVCSLLLCGSARAQLTALNGKKVSAAAFDHFLKNAMDSIGLPGLQVVIIQDGKIVCHRSLGVANTETGVKVNDQSIFEVASMSKPVFAYLVMRMVDKGVLNLDTPLYRYLPYPDIAGDERYKLITARMVLTHRTGLPNWRYDKPSNRPDSSLHIKDGQLYLKFTPGTGFFYSGEGFIYLAKVVAYLNHRTLQTLEPLFEQEVATPLGMQHAWYTGNDYITRHKVTGYINGKAHLHNSGTNYASSWPVSFPDWDSTYFNPAASLHADIMSYAHFLVGWMAGIGLKPATLQEMLSTQYESAELEEVQPLNEGLGVFIHPTPYGITFWHGGNNSSFQSDFVWYKTQRSGYVFFTNCNRASPFNKRLNEFFTNGQ